MAKPLYSIGTWDSELEAYTPQLGLTVPCINVPLTTMRQVVRELRSMGYTCHRFRDADGEHGDNDTSVLIERTDGKEPHWQR
jgi:hypothetical protein